MRKILSVLSILFLLTNNSWATVGWQKILPQTSENPQAISPDVQENNNAIDLMLQNYRDGGVYVKLISTSEIDIGPGGVMLSNAGGSVRLMVANAALTAVSSTMIDTGTISASSTYYLYAYASSTTATTFSVIFSASSSAPTGITYYTMLGSFTTDSSKNFSSATNDVNVQVGLGSWTSINTGQIYHCTTDTFVTGTTSSGFDGNFVTDSNSSPSTVRNSYYSGNGLPGGISGFCRKGDYFEINVSSGSLSSSYSISLGQ